MYKQAPNKKSADHPFLSKLIAPTWDEEHGGVYVPLLNIILQPKSLVSRAGDQDHEWAKAKQMAEAAGGRLFTKKEAYVLLWQKDAINAELEAHDGEPLYDKFWTLSEFDKYNASYVNFSSDSVPTVNKFGELMVRAVIAL